MNVCDGTGRPFAQLLDAGSLLRALGRFLTLVALLQLRLGYLQIPDFMQHFYRIDQTERTALTRRLISTSLQMHDEVTKQCRLIEHLSRMQSDLKSPQELEELLNGIACSILESSGAKLYVVKNLNIERLERLSDPRLSCSFSPTAQRICIVQTAAMSRMPATINNALSHHHYNEKWDGPKVCSPSPGRCRSTAADLQFRTSTTLLSPLPWSATL